MKIEEIYIPCTRKDIRFSKVCIASIRFFYPEIPIILIKDSIFGRFSTKEIERSFNVSLFQKDGKEWGWGFSKILPLLIKPKRRCLIIDSDIIFTHPVLNRLEQYNEDFIVAEQIPEFNQPEHLYKGYFDLDKLRKWDPDFDFKNNSFNGGQIVATTGLLEQKDFEPIMEFSNPVRVKCKDIFPCGEQGITNYVVLKKLFESKITLKSIDFMMWADSIHVPTRLYKKDFDNSEIDSFMLLHYCGHKRRRPWKMKASDLFLNTERLYYSQIRFGGLKRIWHYWDPIYQHEPISFVNRLRLFKQMFKNKK